MQGDKKEPNPARAETKTVVSIVILGYNNLLHITKDDIINQ
jgi:hypothetical protein